jgi:translation initiation factor 2 alpha subunit (eIF-2alpha)
MVKNNIEEGQLVLCNVEKILGTSVFVKIEEYGIDGAITFPEIAPGRIRNIRDFVFPGKKIVCKVLKIHSNSIELSLRRVKTNERNDFNEYHKKEKSYSALAKTILGEKSEQTLNEIKEKENSIVDVFDNCKENPKSVEKYFSKEQAEKICKILREKDNKTKETIISREFSLTSKDPGGINIIKTIILEASKGTNIEFSYIAAGKYLAKVKSKDPKKDESTLNQVIDKIEDLSKKKYCSTCSFVYQKK